MKINISKVKFSRIELDLSNSQKFSPSKITRYTVIDSVTEDNCDADISFIYNKERSIFIQVSLRVITCYKPVQQCYTHIKIMPKSAIAMLYSCRICESADSCN